MLWPFKWKLLSTAFLWYCLLCCVRWFQLLSLWMESYGVSFRWKLLNSTFMWYFLLCCARKFLTFVSVNKIIWCDHSNESYWKVLSCGAVYYVCKKVLTLVSVNKTYGVIIWIRANDQYFSLLWYFSHCTALGKGGSSFMVHFFINQRLKVQD